jgi:hypothetical protein
MVVIAIFFWSQIGDFTRFALMFPRITIVLLFVLGSLLILRGITGNQGLSVCLTDQMNLNVIFTIFVGLFWSYCITKLGFIVTSVSSFTALVWFYQKKRTIPNFFKSLSIAILEVGVLYFLFAKLLYVALPKGIFI